MKYYSDITKRLYETREQLFKAEILQMKYYSDITKRLHETRKPNEDNTTSTKVYDAGKENEIDYSKTIEAIKKMIDDFKVKYPSFGLQDVEDDKVEKTAPTKINGTCGNCSKCVNLADSGYYSSAYINLNGKEFYSKGADSWNDVKKAVQEYFDKKKID